MQLDNVPFCYKEYPAIPEYQCTGHAVRVRLARVIPAVIVLIFVILFIIGVCYTMYNH